MSSMPQIWVGTSWKMNKDLAEAQAFADGLISDAANTDPRIQRFVIPPFTAVRQVKGHAHRHRRQGRCTKYALG